MLCHSAALLDLVVGVPVALPRQHPILDGHLQLGDVAPQDAAPSSGGLPESLLHPLQDGRERQFQGVPHLLVQLVGNGEGHPQLVAAQHQAPHPTPVLQVVKARRPVLGVRPVLGDSDLDVGVVGLLPNPAVRPQGVVAVLGDLPGLDPVLPDQPSGHCSSDLLGLVAATRVERTVPGSPGSPVRQTAPLGGNRGSPACLLGDCLGDDGLATLVVAADGLAAEVGEAEVDGVTGFGAGDAVGHGSPFLLSPPGSLPGGHLNG